MIDLTTHCDIWAAFHNPHLGPPVGENAFHSQDTAAAKDAGILPSLSFPTSTERDREKVATGQQYLRLLRDAQPELLRRAEERFTGLLTNETFDLAANYSRPFVWDVFTITTGIAVPEVEWPAIPLAVWAITKATHEQRDLTMFFLAGHDSTQDFIANSLLVLLQEVHAPQRHSLTTHPHLWPNALSELLRYDCPVVVSPRVATADTEVNGRSIDEGEDVLLFFDEGNKDPSVYPHPHQLNFTREGTPSPLGFGGGAFSCLGAASAKLIGQTALSAIIHSDVADHLSIVSSTRRRTLTQRGVGELLVTALP